MREGLANINGNTPFRANTYSDNQKINNQVIWSSVRVLDIILDEYHPRFKELGGYSSIGTVIFQSTNSPLNDSENNYNYASPLMSNSSNYPLINEIILIVNIPVEGNNVGSKSKYYYISPINLWNTPHHNALPNHNKDLRDNMDSKGNIKIDLTSKYYEGNFEEKNNISPLKKFPGDITYEGRNGNSIRLGSTYKSNSNEWSNSGENGDPIIIIRNGTNVENNNESWVPISENINTDASSIYATVSQQIPIKYTNNFISLPKQPIEVNQYNKPQLILSSDRLVLNAKRDGVLISGEDFVHINSYKDIGLNSNYNITLNSNSINLGSVNAKEQIVLGNKLVNSLINLTQNLTQLMDLLSDLKEYPGGTAVPSPIGAAIELIKPEMESLNNLFKSGVILSKISKTD